MANMKTHFMGLELKNPIIVGSSNLVADLDNLQRLQDAGVAAVVYKSLFEEQIEYEKLELRLDLEDYNERNAEMITLFPNLQHSGPKRHLIDLKKAKEKLKIPIIASLNALYLDTWVEYAKELEKTGVDALELNFYAVPRDPDLEGSTIEEEQVKILRAVKNNVKIPVSVKLSPFYTNTLNLIKKMEKEGASAFILFNRLFEPDIHVKDETHYTPFNLSSQNDNRLALRYAGLLYKNIKAGICCNTGIYSGEDVIKMILAGADCVQIVGTLYKNKIEHISKMLADIEKWMDEKNYSAIKDFKGKLSKQNMKDPFIYKRAQYVDIIMKSENLLKSYPLR